MHKSKNYFSLVIFILIFPILTSAQNNSLAEYIQIAVENNPEINAAFKKFEMSSEEVLQSGVMNDPQLSVGIFISPIETRVGAQKAKLSISQMFPWFGTLKKERKTAKIFTEAEYENFLTVRNRIMYNVKRTWFSIYQAEKEIELSQMIIDNLKSLETVAIRKYETTQSSLADILRIQMQIEDYESELSYRVDKKETLVKEFNLLLDRDIEEEINIPDTLNLYDREIATFNIEQMLNTNPLIGSILKRKEASKNQEQLEKLKALPNWGLGLDYAIIAKRNDVSLTDNGKDAFMPMLSINLPIFRGKYKAAIRKSRLNSERIDHILKSTQNNLILSYENNLRDYKDALRKITLYNEQLQKAGQAMNILLKEYTTSGKNYDEVIDLQQLQYKYQIKLEQAVTDLHLTVAYFEFLISDNEFQNQ